MPRSDSRPSITSLFAFTLIVTPFVYVLSYAPIVRLSLQKQWVSPGLVKGVDGTELPFYRPVDRLIDSTPLRRPLTWWAGIWGVETEFRKARFSREWGRFVAGQRPAQ